MYQFYNPNPCGKSVGDCVVRAITKVLNKDWETVYMDIAIKGFSMCDMPSSNAVWGAYLFDKGFSKHAIPEEDNHTIRSFCEDNKKGVFVLATGQHVVAVIDGTYYDSSDSGNETPLYYWEMGE